MNGETPDEEEAAKLKEQMWTKNTTDVKAMFEAKNQEDAANNETPKQIDLKAEINGTSFIHVTSWFYDNRHHVVTVTAASSVIPFKVFFPVIFLV